MDYEKAYKEAVERAKLFQEKYGGDYTGYIFPELAESEDEKIRKWLIKEMHRFHDCAIKEMCQEDINKTEIALAWLEKQKELTAQIVPGYPGHYFYDGNKLHLCSSPAMEEKQKEPKPNIELIQKSWYMEGYHDREFNCEPRWILKTGEGGPKYELNPRYGEPLSTEQKPVHTAKEMWKEMRLEVYAQASGNRHEPNYSDDSTKMFSLCDIDEIFEKIGDSTVGSQPAEWSKEDENTLRAIHRLIGLGYSEKIMDAQTTTDMREWVNNHFRPQQKQEWSEEDKKMLDECVIAISNWRDAVSNYGHEVAPCQRLIDWLKSLRPHWKPSEEQMETLKSCFHINPATGKSHSPSLDEIYMLSSLYNDLKKL